MLNAFDLLLIGLCIIIMSLGLARRWSVWRMGQPEVRTGNLAGLVNNLLGQNRILKKRVIGVAHIFLSWGFAIFLVLFTVSQFRLTLPSVGARILSFGTDILGFIMLLGTLFLLTKQLKGTNHNETTKGILIPIFVLLVILLTGFLAEGARLLIIQSGSYWTLPVGWLFSNISLPSPLFMQFMIRFHFLAVLFFLAILPFTFMRHLVTAPINVYYNNRFSGELRRISLEEGLVGARTIGDFTWKQLLDIEACVSCGRCDENCPAFLSGKPLSPQRVIRKIMEQMEEVNRDKKKSGRSAFPLLENVVTEDEIWSCTLCMACLESCPVYIPCFDKLVDLRRNLVMMKSKFFTEIGTLFRDVETFGDTFGKGKALREDWSLGVDVRKITNGDQAEILFWVGCQGTFHDKGRSIVTSLANLFKEANLSFAILGKYENCCGDPIRRIGNEYLFQKLAKRNIELLHGLNFNKIVTYCPHCFNMLKNEYRQFGATFEVIHYTELLRDLFKKKGLKIKKEIEMRAVYHDPCYLARVNNIHKAPRDILKSIPGMKVLEPEHSRRDTHCCGAGGGHIWMREVSGGKINEARVKELIKDKPEIILTSCPYCLVMFEDALRSLGIEDVKCMDIVDILHETV